MTALDLTRAGLLELGEGVTNEDLAAYARERHGAHVDTRFIPLYRATIKAEVERRRAREEAIHLLGEDRAENGK